MNALTFPPLVVAAILMTVTPSASRAQAPQEAPEPRITVDFEVTPLSGVLEAFADLSERSFIVAPGAEATISARIRDQPWDVALEAVLEAHGLRATEAAPGILIVGPSLTTQALAAEAAPVEPLETRVFEIRWSPADELADVVWSVLSDRGRLAVAESTNALVVTDEPSVLSRVAELLGTGG